MHPIDKLIPPSDQWQLLSLREAEDQVIGIFRQIRSRWEPPDGTRRPFDYLSQKDRTFAFVAFLEMEVMNGGFDQWFNNPTGDFVAETRVAARDMNLEYLAHLVRDAEVTYVVAHRSDPEVIRVDELNEHGVQYEAWRADIFRAYATIT